MGSTNPYTVRPETTRRVAPMGAALPSKQGVRRTGIIRHMDELGRIVIPIEIRKRFGLSEKDPLEISIKRDTILLNRPRENCVFCGAGRVVEEHRGRSVCKACIDELTAAYA
jgi:transcriptional pleiotropic regulator of transition state genes